jgi:hypothetical protein
VEDDCLDGSRVLQTLEEISKLFIALECERVLPLRPVQRECGDVIA